MGGQEWVSPFCNCGAAGQAVHLRSARTRRCWQNEINRQVLFLYETWTNINCRSKTPILTAGLTGVPRISSFTQNSEKYIPCFSKFQKLRLLANFVSFCVRYWEYREIYSNYSWSISMYSIQACSTRKAFSVVVRPFGQGKHFSFPVHFWAQHETGLTQLPGPVYASRQCLRVIGWAH